MLLLLNQVVLKYIQLIIYLHISLTVNQISLIFKSLPRNPLDCSVLESSVFDNFGVANKLFAKALQSFRTSLAVSYSQQEN